MRSLAATLGIALLLGSSVTAAQEFRTITDQSEFVELISGRNLTRFGIKLEVTYDGEIVGRAFGRPVTGRWNWSADGYFCRDLSFGSRALGLNCQQVSYSGETIRFIADRGTGDIADLTLE